MQESFTSRCEPTDSCSPSSRTPILQWILPTNFANTSTTPSPVFALAYIQSAPNLLAQALPSSPLTSLSSSRSFLAPTNTSGHFSGAAFSIWVSHLAIFLKDFSSEMEQRRRMPLAFLKQAGVRVWKRSCPAVSQICMRYRMPQCTIVFSLKSTPMVAVQESLKES